MNKKRFYLIGAVLLLGLGLTSCLKPSDTPELHFTRENLGSAKVNGKEFEHTVYLANLPYRQNNPYFYYSEKHKVGYFPIYLSPKGSDVRTPTQYGVILYLDLSKGVPELNKPYEFKPTSLVNSLSPNQELFSLFIKEKAKLLPEGAQGIAVVYRRGIIERSTAEGSITFTSFDTKKGTCTATYQLKTTAQDKSGELSFTHGMINTKIYTDRKVEPKK